MKKHTFTINKRGTIAISALLSMIIIIFNLYYVILNTKIECNELEKLFVIPKGASANSVGNLLESRYCLQKMTRFKIALNMTFNSRSIRHGRYDLKGINTIGQLIKLITSPSKDRVRVTLLEGWDIKLMANKLHQKLSIDREKFVLLCNDLDFIDDLNVSANSLEGFLFPDTYLLLKTYSEEEIIKVLVNQFHYKYNGILQEIDNKNMDMLEVLTLASIIQGEAVYHDEMSIISSVYHNRLDSNMLLQADPTIQYIVPGKPRRLFNKDLEIDNPYNTYKYKGLPPGPINSPGEFAIKAALNPDTTEYFYFVSNGEGRHIFSINNAQHNKAKFQLKRKRRLKK